MTRDSSLTTPRVYAEGIGEAVADRTINRVKENGERETWEDVSERVALGNAMLAPKADLNVEYHDLNHHLRQASLLMSGRHLQHGDKTQPERNQEVFTNCSTAAMSFLSFYLLLNGSGVGRAYDDAMMAVNWSNLPVVVPVIDGVHGDVMSGEIQAIDRRQALHLYGDSECEVYMVEDSREGWAKAVARMEVAAFEYGESGNLHANDKVLLIDFSNVRKRGMPIGGMQDRPASGPGPIMNAISNIAKMRETTMDPWRQAMYVDHYLAECVLVGGARRAARMATKDWRDENIFGFITVKRPIEFEGLTGLEIEEYKKEVGKPLGFLWTSNNSVTVDKEFWRLVKEGPANDLELPLYEHAMRVLELSAEASYYDETGEPGFINQDKLAVNEKGMEEYIDGLFAGSQRLQLDDGEVRLASNLASRFLKCDYKMITNPCGEITLSKLGGYCVIADVVPYHSKPVTGEGVELSEEGFNAWDSDAEDAFRVATRALIRTNTMDCLYRPEVTRTNRIGVGMTGLHEYAFARFNLGWKEIVDEEVSKDFWMMLARFKRAVVDEAKTYSAKLGVNTPHTDTTMKPAGTTSKLFGLSEGAHLPAMKEYLRWVQFRSDDPLIEQYREKGYPIRELKIYQGTTIVGFPTQPEICRLGMGDRLVTAAEATPEEQYEFLRLLEKYYILGVEEDGVTPLAETGNQVSYTLKYNPEIVSYNDFLSTLIEGQSSIRCCSVMPQVDATAYEYQPEQPVTKHEFEAILEEIERDNVKEDIGMEHVDCGSGGCPIDFNAA